MSYIITREDLAAGKAFVTTLDDVRKVRDRAVAAAIAEQDAELSRLREENAKLRALLKCQAVEETLENPTV